RLQYAEGDRRLRPVIRAFTPHPSSNQPGPCLAVYPMEHLVDHLLLLSSEPVVRARSAWPISLDLVGTVYNNRGQPLHELLGGTEEVARAHILHVVHDENRGPQRAEVKFREANAAPRIALVKP